MAYEIIQRAIMANIIGLEEAAMSKSASDLSNVEVLRHLILQVLDLVEAEQERNACQDQKLEVLRQGIHRLDQKQQGYGERLEFLETQFPLLRYQVDRNLELEFMENPYSLDGDARCNS